MGRVNESNEPVLVGLCDHCGKIEHNKYKSDCPDGFALYWTKLESKELKQKTIEFKKLETKYQIEKSKQIQK